jgi:hypothetical protein
MLRTILFKQARPAASFPDSSYTRHALPQEDGSRLAVTMWPRASFLSFARSGLSLRKQATDGRIDGATMAYHPVRYQANAGIRA